MPPKTEAHHSETGPVEATMTALNPTVGTSLLDKTLPLIVTLAWLALGGALIFMQVPNEDFAKSLWGILGVPVGIYLRQAGIVPKP
jgi:hypothetical protein